jgi:hypothetical protein
MLSTDNASRVGMVVFLLIATFLYVREEIWSEHATYAKAKVLENTRWNGGLRNQSPMTLTDVEFLRGGNLTRSKMRCWIRHYQVGEVLEIAYESADPSWVYPAAAPTLERPSAIMASIGGFFGLLSVGEFLRHRHRRKIRGYLRTCEQAEADPTPCDR